jgi:hypothetical protein
MVQARALQIEMERRAPATATPAPAKLQQARAALAQAEQKARVKGPAEVVVEFLDLEGTLAMVPSSRGVGRYLVRLRDGAAYQCDCEGNAQFNESCWHLRAATVAYAHCDAQRGTVLRAKVLRAREGIRAEAQATLH